MLFQEFWNHRYLKIYMYVLDAGLGGIGQVSGSGRMGRAGSGRIVSCRITEPATKMLY